MEQPALHDLLCEILGSEHCYFNPPADIFMSYPCIVYNYTNDMDDFADNIHYRHSKRYTITIIDEDPDSKIPSKMRELPYCSSDRNFASSGLSHFVFSLHYSGPRIKEILENESDVVATNGREN